MAEAATRYWRVRIDFDHAVSIAQREEIPEAAYHPVVDSHDLRLVDRYREALVRQLLTPAPDLMSVTWNKAALATHALERLPEFTGRLSPPRLGRYIHTLAFRRHRLGSARSPKFHVIL
jgi:hypothetical protein